MDSSPGYPLAGRDYPRSWNQLRACFPDDSACLSCLPPLRWPEGFVCPACGSSDGPYSCARTRVTCRGCHHQTTVTAGTIFDKTRTPVISWFAATWSVTNQKATVSAVGLQRVLGPGSYQTAWTKLHKLRWAMVRPDRDRLPGGVEVDESYIGGPEEGVHGRQPERKAIVAIAVAVHEPKELGPVRPRRIPDVSGGSLVPVVCEVVEPGSAHADGWGGYGGLSKRGYCHEITLRWSVADPAHVSMPAVHRVSSLLKRWLLGTHQGGVGHSQLDLYLELLFGSQNPQDPAKSVVEGADEPFAA
ncbi:MAG: IS1595 family transposase [Spirochaetales bacterium]|nr:IS1595 family transposase [Spirochaetales bacterium]